MNNDPTPVSPAKAEDLVDSLSGAITILGALGGAEGRARAAQALRVLDTAIRPLVRRLATDPDPARTVELHGLVDEFRTYIIWPWPQQESGGLAARIAVLDAIGGVEAAWVRLSDVVDERMSAGSGAASGGKAALPTDPGKSTSEPS